MTIITDETGTYVSKSDGTRDYGCATSFKINDQSIYEFNQETGVLRMAILKGDLELLVSQLGDLSKTGKDLTLPTPLGEQLHFKGVKKIESIPGLNESSYLIKIGK